MEANCFEDTKHANICSIDYPVKWKSFTDWIKDLFFSTEYE